MDLTQLGKVKGSSKMVNYLSDMLGIIVPDEEAWGALQVIASTISSAALAGFYMVKKHLSKTDEAVAKQARRAEECEKDRNEMKTSHQRLKDRTESLERGFLVATNCPQRDCPNKQLMAAATSVVGSRPSAGL